MSMFPMNDQYFNNAVRNLENLNISVQKSESIVQSLEKDNIELRKSINECINFLNSTSNDVFELQRRVRLIEQRVQLNEHTFM